jgi:hypothetical protein
MTSFYCLRFETPPNLEDQVPVFISPRNRVARLYPQALGFSLTLQLTSQSRSHVTTEGQSVGLSWCPAPSDESYRPLLYSLRTDRIQNTLKTRITAIPLLLQRCVYVAVAQKRRFFCCPHIRFHKNASRCPAVEIYVTILITGKREAFQGTKLVR